MDTRTITTASGTRSVSALCLGAMLFGTRTDRDTAEAILDRFVEAGGTFIDTSNNYNQWYGRGGESEQILGGWMAERGNRDSLALATKVGAQMVSGTNPDTGWEGLGADTIKHAVTGSLQRLGTDRIELYYAHVDDRETSLEETVGAFGELAAAGVIGAVGCSNYATWRMERARNIAAAFGSAPYTAIQQEYTYLWPRPVPGRVSPNSVELTDYLDVHRDVTLMAYSPLLGGSYGRPERPFPASRGYAHASAYARFEVLRQVAADLGATPNQVALAWLLQQDPQVIPIFGASSLAQLEEALQALELTLDADTVARLDAA
jgi:aryl-alcohol dehydrogenase-like predicted oxidoreductase